MNIRKANSEDIDSILRLFEDTVKKVNKDDYSSEQIDAWVAAKNKDTWLQKIAEQSFYIAIVQNRIAGFSSIDSEGYLDFMFVHHKFQRQGIAKALLAKIEETASSANLERIWTSASITAQPFFSKHGYKHYENEHRILSGVHFKNALMEKVL